MRTAIHKKMKNYLTDHGLQQKFVAATMNISESRLSYMLNGGRRITIDDFFRFCETVGADPKTMYYEDLMS